MPQLGDLSRDGSDPLGVGVAQGIDPDAAGKVDADLANLMNESALLAARANKNEVDTSDIESAKDRVIMGAERRSMVIPEKDKRVTAFHEAGHTIVAIMTKGADPVHKVSIIPRGMALGVTMQLPSDDRYNDLTLYATYFLHYMVLMNVGLAVFNLIPVPPLDGSRVLLVFLPQRLYFGVMRYEKVILAILLAVVWYGALNGPIALMSNAVWGLLYEGTSWVDQLAYTAYYSLIGTKV